MEISFSEIMDFLRGEGNHRRGKNKRNIGVFDGVQLHLHVDIASLFTIIKDERKVEE